MPATSISHLWNPPPAAPRFPLGQVFITAGALDWANAHPAGAVAGAVELSDALLRHHTGDWGDVDPTDATLNDHALTAGGRILSAYRLPHTNHQPTTADVVDDTEATTKADTEHAQTTIWIITEANRTTTTILLPTEY